MFSWSFSACWVCEGVEAGTGSYCYCCYYQTGSWLTQKAACLHSLASQISCANRLLTVCICWLNWIFGCDLIDFYFQFCLMFKIAGTAYPTETTVEEIAPNFHLRLLNFFVTISILSTNVTMKTPCVFLIIWQSWKPFQDDLKSPSTLKLMFFSCISSHDG